MLFSDANCSHASHEMGRMRLEDLPAVILRDILNGQSSWASIELWKCGSRKLNSRLANKGITHIELKDTDANSPSRWPRCLKEFKLESLSIDRGEDGPLGTLLTLQDELKRLSSTLKVLKVTGRGVANAIFSRLSNSRVSAPHSSVFDVRDLARDAMRPVKRAKHVETDSTQPHAELWNLNTSFPKLERLDVKGQLGHTNFGPSIFSMLPRSLTWFDFPHRLAEGATNDLSVLPRRLQTLLLVEWSIGVSGLMTLPKSITDIRFGLNLRALSALLARPQILPQILPRLCRLPAVHRLQNAPWPASLREMELDTINEDTLSRHLPELTRLEIFADTGAFRSEYVARLPRTLTELDLWAVDWEGVMTAHWPPSLTRMISENGNSLSPRHFSLLPRSLTELLQPDDFDKDSDEDSADSFNDGWNEESDEESDQAISRGELLAIGRGSLLIDRKSWKKEKRRLKTPHFVALGSKAYIKRVEKGELFGLPLGLTTFSSDHNSLKLHQYVLPPNIRQTRVVADLNDRNALDHLPPSDSLHLRLKLSAPKLDSPIRHEQSALYRSNVKHLDLTLRSPEVDHPLHYLPRSLQTLKFQGPAAICNTNLADLPPNLVTLNIDCELTHSAKPWVDLLPGTLTSLGGYLHVYGSEIIYLPPRLTHLRASMCNVTLVQARQLPRQLRTLDAGCGDRSDGDRGLLNEDSWKVLQRLCRPFWRIHEYSNEYLTSELRCAHLPNYAELADVDRRTERRYASSWQSDGANDDTESSVDEITDDIRASRNLPMNRLLCANLEESSESEESYESDDCYDRYNRYRGYDSEESYAESESFAFCKVCEHAVSSRRVISISSESDESDVSETDDESDYEASPQIVHPPPPHRRLRLTDLIVRSPPQIPPSSERSMPPRPLPKLAEARPKIPLIHGNAMYGTTNVAILKSRCPAFREEGDNPPSGQQRSPNAGPSKKPLTRK